MSVKQILIIVILAVLVGGSAVILVKSQSHVSPTSQPVEPTPTPTSVALTTWTDEAGFSFQYPEGITIDKHPDDNADYANLTLNLSPSNTVNIIMSDNTYKDLNAWAGQNLAVDTTLNGKLAKKIIKDGQTTIACIDNGVIVTITGQDVSSIVDSWTFIYPTPTIGTSKTAPATTNGSGDILQEE